MKRLSIAVLLLGFVAASAAWAEDGVLLRYKFNKGDKRSYSHSQHVESDGAPNNTDQVLSEEVADATPGMGRIARTVTRMKLAMDNPMLGKVEFDSDKPGDKAKAAGNPILMSLTLLLDKPVTVQLSERGKVEKLEGLDKVLAPLGPMGMMVKGTIEDAIKQTYTELPEQPVKKGDSWKQTTKISNPQFGTIEQNYTYTFSGVEEKDGIQCAKIAVQLATGVKRAKKPGPKAPEETDDLTDDDKDGKEGGDTAPAKEEGDAAAAGTGTIWFALDGYLVASEVTTPQAGGTATVKVALVK